MDYSKLLATSSVAFGLGVAVLPGCRNEPNAAQLAGTATASTTVGTEIDDTIVTTSDDKRRVVQNSNHAHTAKVALNGTPEATI